MRFLRKGAFFSIQHKPAVQGDDGTFFIQIKRGAKEINANSPAPGPIIFAMKPTEAAEILARYEQGNKVITLPPHFAGGVPGENSTVKNLEFTHKTFEKNGKTVDMWAVVASEKGPTVNKSFAFGLSIGEMRAMIEYVKQNLLSTFYNFVPQPVR